MARTGRWVVWSCCAALTVALASCGDDATPKPAGGEAGDGAGGDGAGVPGGASGGDAASGGVPLAAAAGEASAGMPASLAGAPAVAGGAGGSESYDPIIATDQAAPKGIALDSKNVYWANSGDGTIVSCPLSGCGGDEPTVVVSNAPGVRGIAVDAQNVYWMSDPNVGNQSSIKKCPLVGCPAQPTVLGDVISDRPNDVHVVGTQLFYTAWPDFGRCTSSDCSEQARSPLAQAPVVSLDTDDQYIYLSQHGWETIMRCDRNDCENPLELAAMQRAISIAVDFSTLYFAKLAPLDHGAVEQTGIYSCPIAGCGDEAPAIVLPDVHAYAIALSPTRVYYTEVDAGIVASIPK